MLTRYDLELMGIKLNDEQWNETRKQLAEVEERMYEEEHPLDE